MGVPILTSKRYEADDVIGTLTMKAAAQGFEVAIVTGDKDFFQLVQDGIKVYNPKEEGTWYDAAGVKEKFGVSPEQVVDVLALMGDSIDNIKGVPGIGEKGARDLIATYGDLDNLLAHAAEVSNKRQREGLLNHADDARQSRDAGAHSHGRPGRIRARVAALSRRVARAAASTLFSRSASARWSWSSRRRRRRCGKDYAAVETHAKGWRRSRPSCGRPGGSRCACCPTSRRRCGRRSSGLSFSTAPRQARYVPLVRSGLGFDGGARPARGAGGAATGARGSGGQEGRSRPQIRRHRARAPRRRAPRARDRHDDRELSRGRDALVAPARGPGARAHWLQGADRGGRLRPRREVGVVRPDPGPGGAGLCAASGRIWRCSSRRTAARAAAERRARRAVRAARAPADSGADGDRARRASRIDGPALASQAQDDRPGAATGWRAASTSSRARSSTSTRPRSSAEILFDKMGLTTETLRRTSKTKAHSTAFEVLEELGWRTSCRGWFSSGGR